MEEEWSDDLFDEIEKIILDDPFVLKNLNYTHYYFYDPDNYEGTILSTSIRLYPSNNIWCKRVVTRYLDSNMVEKEISYERDIDDSIAKKIEKKVDLRKLDNNYSSDLNLMDEDGFELIYNNIYKIVGTNDKKIEEIEFIKNILLVNDIIEDEKKKVRDLL
jgi:hypothetical protein